MEKIEVNSVPTLFKSGKITKEEAAKAIWVDVYMNPSKYALCAFSKDELSDFLLKFQSRFYTLAQSYSGKSTDFTTFVRGCIAFYKLTWRKNMYKDLVAQESLSVEMRKGALESMPLADFRSDPILQDFNLKVRRRKHIHRRIDASSLRLAQQTALVLALKSCKVLDEKSMQKLSHFTGKSFSEILQMKERLCEKTKAQDEKFKKIRDKRDSSFFKKRKFAMELERLDPNSTEFKRVQKSLEIQTKRWQIQNEKILNSSNFSPKSEDIAKELGLKLRKVFYCISHARQNGVIQNMHEIFKNECPEDDDE